jgi:hypothetical protein
MKPLEVGSKFCYNGGVSVKIMEFTKLREHPAIRVQGKESGRLFEQVHALSYVEKNLQSGFWRRSSAAKHKKSKPQAGSKMSVKSSGGVTTIRRKG